MTDDAIKDTVLGVSWGKVITVSVGLAVSLGGILYAIKANTEAAALACREARDNARRVTILETKYETDVQYLRRDITDQKTDLRDIKVTLDAIEAKIK